MGSSTTRFYGTELPTLLTKIKLDNKKILDLGAGDGELIYALPDTVDRANVTAVELNYNRCKNIEKECGCTVICDDATYTKLPRESYDIIICNQVIEHIYNDIALLDEIYQLLSKGGICYLSTILKDRFNFGYRRNEKGERVLDPTHIIEYTNDVLYQKLLCIFGKVFMQKTPVWFSITDFILPRLGIQGHIYEKSKWLRQLRKIKLPVVGYYNWEFLLWKST